MKIAKHVTKLVLISLICLSAFVYSDTPKVELAKNQLKAFPNTYEAPTAADQIAGSNYTAPPFSRSLMEANPQKKLRFQDFVHLVKFPLYHLTRGELEQVFIFVDEDKDDLIDQKEWDIFTGLFILPFEACDANKDYLLDDKEFKTCFDADPRSKVISFRKNYDQDKYTPLMDVVSTRGKALINFNDYLIIRKALFGWNECQSHPIYLAKTNFRCALKHVVSHRFQFPSDIDGIYDTGLKLSADKSLIEHDFVSYLKTVYFAYVYFVFGSSNDRPALEKQEFLRAIKQDKLPNNFEEKEITLIFQLMSTKPTTSGIESMSFSTFSFFFNLHRLFNKYSAKKPLQLTEDEFLQLLNDPFTPKDVVSAIDESTGNFTTADYQEASLILHQIRPNEHRYYRFKQDASLQTHAVWLAANNTNATAAPGSDVNRKIFFTIMTDYTKTAWSKANYYRAFQLSNLFLAVKSDQAKPVIQAAAFVSKLLLEYDKTNPSINLNQRKNYMVYKLLPEEVNFDLLLFLSLENLSNKLEIEAITSALPVTEIKVREVLKNYGMEHMPETVLDVAKNGFDAARRRQFVALDLAKTILLVQAAACEKAREQQIVTKEHLAGTDDASRKFNDLARRALSSLAA